MELDYYENLSDDSALHRWPTDGTKLRAGQHEDRADVEGHAGYGHVLLGRVRAKAGEIGAALDAQGSFEHTSEYAKNTPLIQILTALAAVEVHMDAQWARHLGDQTVAVIDGEGRRLVEQALGGLFVHMKDYLNAASDGRVDELRVPAGLFNDVEDFAPDARKVGIFLG